jgi:hypothetical protein
MSMGGTVEVAELGQVRSAMSHEYYEVESHEMRQLARAPEVYGRKNDHVILELRLDETHFDVSVDSVVKDKQRDGCSRPVVQFKGTLI